ncbi:hypothetical protein [Candidatus Hodarchaeum mangrovi]
MAEIPPAAAEEEELKLAKRIFDLNKIIEENSSLLMNLKAELSEIRTDHQKWIKKIEDLDIRLDSKFSEITHEFNEINNNYSIETRRIEEKINTKVLELEPKIQELSEKASNNYSEISERITAIQEELNKKVTSDTFEDIKNGFSERINDLNQKIEALENNLNFKYNTIETVIGEKEQKIISSYDEKFLGIRKDFDEENSKISNELNLVSETLQMLVESVQNINKVNENHNDVLDSYQSAFSDLKDTIKEIISISKEDQKELFDSFSTILESNNEDIRTEITVTTQTLLDSDKNIIDKSKELFMQKKSGDELKQTIIELTGEIRSESQKTRDDLLKGLQSNVEEYEKVITEQNINIKSFQEELELFKKEIHAIIDRKVNEKYEVVYKLLGRVLTLSEEHALLLKASEIKLPLKSKRLPEITTNLSQSEDEASSSDSLEDEDEKEKGI